MKKRTWTLINTGMIATCIFIDLTFVSASSNPLRLFVHAVVSLTLFPIVAAGLFSLLLAAFNQNMNTRDAFKVVFKYVLFAILFFFLTGSIAAALTGRSI